MLTKTEIDVKQEYMSDIFKFWISNLDYQRIYAQVSRRFISLNTGISVGQLEKGQSENYANYTLEKLLDIIDVLEKIPQFKPPYPGFNSRAVKIWISDLDRRRRLKKVTAVQVGLALDIDSTTMKYWRERNYMCIKVNKFIELCKYLESVGVDTKMYN